MTNFTSLHELYKLFIECNGLVSTDTRKIEKGALFVALKGDNFNANAFAEKAIHEGCKYALVDDESYLIHPNIKLVSNTLKTLQQLANHHRKQFTIPVLAITGSNGKTTNKELIHAVLSKKYNTLATLGNLNNHIGVPLTLLRLKKEHTFAVIEMGANHQGEINELCEIADPDFGLITNIGKAHLEGFGGIEGVKKGKSELYKFLAKKGGLIFINGDDEVLNTLSEGMTKITYGLNENNNLSGNEISAGEFLSFSYKRNAIAETETIQSQLVGGYNLINCLAAMSIGAYFKVDPIAIKEAIEGYKPEMNRSQLVKTKNNKLILDAYNANPNSMKSAIENFAKFTADNKTILLGDMFELGEYSNEEHQGIIELLQHCKFNNVILIGEAFFKTKAHEFKKFKTTAETKLYLSSHPITKSTILIKGSRGMKLETLQEVL